MEKNKIKLNIAGESYNLVSDDSPEYMAELAKEVDLKIAAVLKGGKISTTQAAVLVALEYADASKKNGESTDNLRAQLKNYLEDAAQAKSERDTYKREVERLKAAKNAEESASGRLW